MVAGARATCYQFRQKLFQFGQPFRQLFHRGRPQRHPGRHPQLFQRLPQVRWKFGSVGFALVPDHVATSTASWIALSLSSTCVGDPVDRSAATLGNTEPRYIDAPAAPIGTRLATTSRYLRHIRIPLTCGRAGRRWYQSDREENSTSCRGTRQPVVKCARPSAATAPRLHVLMPSEKLECGYRVRHRTHNRAHETPRRCLGEVTAALQLGLTLGLALQVGGKQPG